MDHASLKLFRDIAQSRSFSKGAGLNGISQSAASQQVQDLERQLGTVLLDRSTRPLSVTPSGQLFQDFCRDALRLRDEFEAALGRLRLEVEGEVRVASIYSIGISEVAQLERDFAIRFPQAKLNVQYLRPEKVYEAVRSDEADLGLVSYPETSREICVIPWRQEEMILATAPDHALARKAALIAAPLAPEELNGLEFVAFDDDLPIRREVDRFLKDLGVDVKVTVHFDNVQMVKEAVALKKGVSILPARAIRDEVRQKRLAAVRLTGAELYRPLGIIHRKKKRFTQVAQAFLDLLQEKPQ